MSSPKNQGRTPVPTDFEAVDSKVELRCLKCDRKGKYLVGRIFVDPKQVGKPHDASWKLSDALTFSGYFRCRHCGAGGPWELTPSSQLLLTALMMEARMAPDKARLQVGRMQLFDGTVTRTATEAEEHLKRMIEARPDDAFLWSRLGNVYENAEERELALSAFRKAVELNPGDVESHHSIGCYLQDEEPARAIEHFQRVLQHARTAPRRQPQLLRDVVRDAIERLVELHEGRSGQVPLLPPSQSGWPDERAVLDLRRLDLDTEEGVEDLVTFFLEGKAPPARQPPSLPRGPFAPAPRTQPARIGRNDRCPCGSGKKFKHCCGRS